MQAKHLDHNFEQRNRLIRQELVRLGVSDRRVLQAMLAIPRELFVPASLQQDAYANEPVPIGLGQTISQPLMVAIMLEASRLKPEDRVLEIGTGSGYAAAILSQLASQVFTIERFEELANSAKSRLTSMGIENVKVKVGDGCLGWSEAAPFDVIVVAAGGPGFPHPLLEQLAIGGILIIPVGPDRESQFLYRVTRSGDNKFEKEKLDAVRFVPLVGAEAWPE